jgi:D-aminoacyl-tRNA deacylase
MRAVIQTVTKASVTVKNKKISSIGHGLVLLLGIANSDTSKTVNLITKKLLNLRIFPDIKGKMNLNIVQVSGSILVVSQFTLLANLEKGNRPSFNLAASNDKARKLYQLFISKIKITGINVKAGKFAAHMQVSLVNDGPVTIVLDS